MVFGRRVIAALCLGVLFGCADQNLIGPELRSGDVGDQGSPHLTVMTRNLYVGADVDAVIAALVSPDPSDDLPTLLGAIAVSQETDLPARMAAIAREIRV